MELYIIWLRFIVSDQNATANKLKLKIVNAGKQESIYKYLLFNVVRGEISKNPETPIPIFWLEFS